MATTLPSQHNVLVQAVKAAPLELKSVPTPQVTPGSAIVKIISTPVVSYSKEVLNGTRNYAYPTPFVPGPSAIGRIAALGADSTLLNVGDLVYVDCVVRSRDNPTDIILMGISQGMTPGSGKLMADAWRDGTFAEYARVPMENVFALNEGCLIKELGYTEQELTMLARYLIPYGGLHDIKLEVGETIIITPATGAFGGAAVAVALALGAQVIATGRNEASLKRLVENFGAAKVKTVTLTNDIETDTQALSAASSGRPIDAVFEISPPAAAHSTHIKSAILALKRGGRVSLMGGIKDDYAIPISACMRKDLTLKGKWMYERPDILSLIRLVETGRLEMGQRNGVMIVGDYPFEQWEVALNHASEKAGWDTQVLLRPGN